MFNFNSNEFQPDAVCAFTDIVSMVYTMPLSESYADMTLREISQHQAKMMHISQMATVLTTVAAKKPGTIDLIDRILNTACEMVTEEIRSAKIDESSEPV